MTLQQYIVLVKRHLSVFLMLFCMLAIVRGCFAEHVCVYRKDHLGTAKISEGTAIIMYFAEIKANEQ